MEINIRNAEESDFSQLLGLFKEFAEFENLPERMLNSLERMKEERYFFNCFVAETGDKKIIGYVTHFFCYYTWTGKCLYMDDLYVKMEFRGKGIGTRLINQVIEFARSSRCHKLRWQVSNWNEKAIGFYRSIGATIDDVERNCDLII